MERWLTVLSWLNVALTIIFILSSTAWTIQFYVTAKRDREDSFMAMRRPSATMACCVSSILFFALNRLPLALWSQLGVARVPYFYFVSELSYLIFGVGAIYCVLYRSYIIWYEVHCQMAAKDKDWRLLINESEENWFLRPSTRSTFGDYRRVSRVLAGCVVAGAVPTMSYLAMKTWHWNEVNDLNYLGIRVQSGMLSILPALCIGGIWQQTPILDDHFWILAELRLILRVAFSVMLLQCGIVVLGNPEPGTVLYLVFLFLTTFCAAIVVHTMTVGVMMKRAAFDRVVGDDEAISIKTIEVMPDALDRSENTIKLRTLLQDERGFELFMRWLTKEWSSENLLFTLETVQFQLALHAHGRKSVAEDKKSPRVSKRYSMSSSGNSMQFVPPKSLPQSDIVYGSDTDLHGKAVKLVAKYVAFDAVFLINISGAASHRIMERIEAVGERKSCRMDPSAGPVDEALLTLFDEAQKQIWNVMEGSFLRFKSTPEFRSFAAHIRAEPKKVSLLSKYKAQRVAAVAPGNDEEDSELFVQ